MMIGFVSFVHIIICFLLVLVILMQSGRGAGLAEGFSSAESFFGARTSAFMVKTTTVLAAIFLVTCLSLAFLSSQKGKSLMAGKTAAKSEPVQLPSKTLPEAEKEAPKPLEAAATVNVVPQTDNAPSVAATADVLSPSADTPPVAVPVTQTQE